MKLSLEKFRKILVEPGFVTEDEFKKCQKQAKEKNKSLDEVLIEKDLITDEQLGKLIAEELDYSFINLREETIPYEVINIVPELVAREQQIIVFNKTKQGLKVAMAGKKNRRKNNFLLCQSWRY